MTNGSGTGHPVTYEVSTPDRVDNWRPLVQWFLAIPHLIIARALQALSFAVVIVSLIMILVTGALPPTLFDLQVMCQRYQYRAWAYAGFLHATYPPFDFTSSATDPGGDAVVLGVDRPEVVNRWLPLVKWLLAVPHYLVLVVLTVAAAICWLVAFFAVLFTGRWPDGLRTFVIDVNRYSVRVWAYVLLLRDEYPPFSLR
jgi:hypothetical protein